MGDVVQVDKFSRLPERYQRRAREIASRVSEIDALCSPATSEAIGSELKRMRRQLLPQPGIEDADMAKGYLDACRDLPEWALAEAANDYLGGKVDNHTGRYMPLCAEFAKRARSILMPFLAERAGLRTEASKLVERATDEARRDRIAVEKSDPAVKARVATLVEKVTKGAAKKLSLTHTGIDDDARRRMDVLRKPVPFKSKIDQTKIGRS
jgi:hypothetical protein